MNGATDWPPEPPTMGRFRWIPAYHDRRIHSMKRAVIFDLDGTLLNSLEDLAAAANFALRNRHFPERTVEEVRRFIGNGVPLLIKRRFPPVRLRKWRPPAWRTSGPIIPNICWIGRFLIPASPLCWNI